MQLLMPSTPETSLYTVHATLSLATATTGQLDTPQTVDPAELLEPSGHGVHAAGEDIASSVPNLPTGHGTHVTGPDVGCEWLE
jgi:hypothetical protein